ncbi:MAG: alpha/beta fold hydrolase, partial [Actinomycetota bacterium]|nr:alpha/beta fold hydrolase [Actinomycetota bacterium]
MGPTAEALAARCAADGELAMAVRYWTGGVRLEMGNHLTGVTIVDGAIVAGVPEPGEGVVTIRGDSALWEPLLLTVPPRYKNDVSVAVGRGGLQRQADDLMWWQYLPAIQRVVELLRAPGLAAEPTMVEGDSLPRFDSPVGRYVHLDLDGHDHRIYYEEAGTGIPMLLQHTAGSHGTQWRHLFENPAITDRFRLIAYDLPFHGKSVPPVGRRWWEEQYKLTGEFLRSIPLQLSDALGLDRPAFMGCSVGGLLALDLAAKHPESFRAVISVEGALHIGGDWHGLDGFWHPQVSNETKARMMEGL